jgi:hypothetical protein
VDVQLGDAEVLDEVVVTALGISRETKSLGYAVQELDGDALAETREVNVVDFGSLKNELENHVESKYNFKSWQKSELHGFPRYEKCEGSICYEIVLIQEADSYAIRIRKEFSSEKKQPTSDLVYNLINEDNTPELHISLTLMEKGEQVPGEGLAISNSAGQCLDTKKDHDRALKRINKGRERVMDQHAIEAYKLCSSKPFSTLLK